MEPMLSSDLMTESVLDYWNPDHNPLLSPTLISSTDSRTIDELYFRNEPQSEIEDRDKIVDHLTDDLKKERHGEMEFTDHNNSPWLDGGEGKEQCLNPQVSEPEGFLPETQFLSPVCANGTGFLDGADKGAKAFLDRDILTTSDLYSPLKENTDMDSAESTAMALADDFRETHRATHLSSLEEKDEDDLWQAVGVMETRQKEEPLTIHNINHPQSNRLMQDNHFDCATKTVHRSVTNNIHPQCLSRTNSHSFSSSAPLGWTRHSAEFTMKNHFKSRKSRCRKPLLRNFQSNFFRLPIPSRSKSPQLHVVKLFRSNTPTGRGSSVQDDLNTNEDCAMKSFDDPTLEVEGNPELALMKTVDMPSGKRVEDIYVVPSVWITSKDSSDVTKCKSLPEQSPNVSHSPNSFGHVTGDDSLYMGKNYSGSNPEPCQNSNLSSFMAPSITSPSCQMTTNVVRKSSPSTKANWSEEGDNGITKNLIITTLNAPKIDMIPSLKDLCKAVLLHDQIPSLLDHAKANSTQSTLLTSVNLKRVSPEASIGGVDKTADQHIYQLSDAGVQGFEENHPDDGANQPSHLLNFELDKENSQIETPSADVLDSFTIQDLPKFNTCTMDSPTVTRNSISTKQRSFSQEREVSDNSSISHDFQENLTENPNTANSLRDDVMPDLDAVMNESFSQASTFSTHSQHMMTSNSCESIHSSCDNTNEGLSEHAYTVSSLPEASSSSSFIDSPFTGESNEEEPNNPPELVILIRQIRQLHLNDPINKPLANLSTTLHLLHDAEKTLCNANFGVYQQMKMGQHSKFGQLIRCILSLTSTVVMMGKSLCEWTRSSADHQCLKTVEVLSNLYQTNIISLIELITPYFHYLCGLIASCHADILRMNTAKSPLETNSTEIGPPSYGMACQQRGRSMVLSDKTNSHFPNCALSEIPGNDCQGYPNHDGKHTTNLCQNSARHLQAEQEVTMVHSGAAQLSHKHTKGSPMVRNHQMKQKMRLLKHKLPIHSKSKSPYMRLVDPKTSATCVKYPMVRGNSTVMAKPVLDDVNPVTIFNANATQPPLYALSSPHCGANSKHVPN